MVLASSSFVAVTPLGNPEAFASVASPPQVNIMGAMADPIVIV